MINKIEFFKLIKSPFLWLLLFVFVAFNSLIIYSCVGESYTNEQFRMMHDIVITHGVENPEVSSIIEPQQADYEDCEVNRRVLEFYYKEYVENYGHLYDDLDMRNTLEQKLGSITYSPKGLMKEFIYSNYDKLQERVLQIKESTENEFGFYPGMEFRFHKTLYRDVGRKIILEIVVISVLCVLYIMDFERIHKTRDIVLSTKTGKNVMKSKIFMGTVSALIFSSLLVLVSFIEFFQFVPFREIWRVPVAASVVAEPRLNMMYPFVTFTKMTEGQYLLFSCLVYLGIVLLTVGVTIAVQLFVQNSYFSFLIIAISMMGLCLFAYFHTGYFVDVILALINPVVLYLTSGGWFMENDILLAFRGNEMAIMGCSAIWIGLLIILGKVRYSRLEIKS